MMLMFAVLMVKVIGLLFKIPLTDMIGAAGRGYFNSAYEIYTPIFAISRIAGWSAHRIEEIQNNGKIIRPAYINVKPACEYKELEKR
jgi:citrate synthase